MLFGFFQLESILAEERYVFARINSKKYFEKIKMKNLPILEPQHEKTRFE